MAANTTPIFPLSFRGVVTNFNDADTTLAKPIFKAGSNGSQVLQGNLSCLDASNNTAKLYYGKEMTLQSNMGVGTFVDGGGGSDTITRTTGSFITDGWKVGDQILVADPTSKNNCFIAKLTAVAALTLTFATAMVGTGEVFPTGSIIYRVGLLSTYVVTALAGTDGSIASVDLIANSKLPIIASKPNDFLQLGANDALILRMGTTLGAAEYTDAFVSGGDY